LFIDIYGSQKDQIKLDFCFFLC